MSLLEEAKRKPLNELLLLAYERLEAIKAKEPLSYVAPEDIAGILGMLIVISNDKSAYSFNRYREVESDEFERFSRNLPLSRVIAILKELHAIDEQDVLSFRERAKLVKDDSILDKDTHHAFLLREDDPQVAEEFIAVHWRIGLSYVIERRHIRARGPYYGYRIVERDVAVTVLKKVFEDRITRLYTVFKTKKIPLPKHGEQVLEEIRSLTATRSSVSLEGLGEKLYERPELRPPCMQILLLRLKETGYLKHAKRFQLGTFLKRAGMDPETQKRFRYEHAVDNVNVPREVFEKRAGYMIEHIYGLQGSKKDYNPPSCRRCRAGDYYCPFSAESPETLREYLKKLGIGEEFIERILQESAKGTPEGYMNACMTFFQAKFGFRPKRPRKNPVGYLYRAVRATERKKKRGLFFLWTFGRLWKGNMEKHTS